MTSSADKDCCDVTFYTGDLVYVSTAHFSLAPGLSKRLALKWGGPFPIEKVIFSVTYRISLPKDYGNIHPVFYVSSLYRHHRPSNSCPPPMFPVSNSFLPEYRVKDILA